MFRSLPPALRALAIVVTAIVAVGFVVPGLLNLIGADQARAAMAHLGFPVWFTTFLGVAKLAGAVAIVAPVGRTLREWAYAGMTFMLIAAALAHTAAGDGAEEIFAPVAVLGLTAASYGLWRASLQPAASPPVVTAEVA